MGNFSKASLLFLMVGHCSSAISAPSVKQYEAEALRQYRLQKAQAEAERRAAEAQERQQREAFEREQLRMQQLQEREQRRRELNEAQERLRAQRATLCEEAVSRETWDIAFRHCKIAADAGDINAIYRLGQLTANGYGTTADASEGFQLSVRAARLGSKKAHYGVCAMIRHGFGTERSSSDAGTCYSELIKSDASSDLRAKAANDLRQMYMLREISPPRPSVPAQVVQNDFDNAMKRAVSENVARVGWGLNLDVRLSLLVGADGGVEGCSFEQLDNEALRGIICQAADQSMRFRPALDQSADPIMSIYSFTFRVQTVTKACAEFSKLRTSSRDIVGGLLAALACK